MLTHLRRSLLRRAFMVVAFVAAFVVVRALLPDQVMAWQSSEQTDPIPAASPASTLLAAHDCWTNTAPDDVLVPGHVVLTLDGASEPAYLGADWVGRALEQIFDGVDHEIDRVHGFCR